MIGDVLIDHWPLFGLRVRTSRPVLRLPRDEEIADLAAVAAAGVHRASERPFLTPWAEGDPQERAHSVLQGHLSKLGSWSARDWRFVAGVFLDDERLGILTLRASEFAVVREVTTSSWLGQRHHGQGHGTETRAGRLTLAFDHLEAAAARTEVFQDNLPSQGVSRKLGYESDGIYRDARGDQVVVSDRLRLTRQKWRQQAHPAAVVTGFAGCRSLFGL